MLSPHLCPAWTRPLFLEPGLSLQPPRICPHTQSWPCHSSIPALTGLPQAHPWGNLPLSPSPAQSHRPVICSMVLQLWHLLPPWTSPLVCSRPPNSVPTQEPASLQHSGGGLPCPSLFPDSGRIIVTLKKSLRQECGAALRNAQLYSLA